jgi:hypothetical protein
VIFTAPVVELRLKGRRWTMPLKLKVTINGEKYNTPPLATEESARAWLYWFAHWIPGCTAGEVTLRRIISFTSDGDNIKWDEVDEGEKNE